MNKYRAMVVVSLSVVLGLFLAMMLSPAYAGGKKAKRPKKATASAKARMKQQPPAPLKGKWGDEHAPTLYEMAAAIGMIPFSTQPNPCAWITMEQNATPPDYNQPLDRASVYFSLACSSGNSSGCNWCYRIALARGSWSLYNLPPSFIFDSGCLDKSFSCDQTDTNRRIYYQGVDADYGAGPYTMFVFVYDGPCSTESGMLPTDGVAFPFNAY